MQYLLRLDATDVYDSTLAQEHGFVWWQSSADYMDAVSLEVQLNAIEGSCQLKG